MDKLPEKKDSYNLLDGFTISYESTCRHCGGKNRISIKWEDGAFEVTQEDTISTRWISVPVTPKVENLPKSFGVSAPAFRHGFLLTS